MRLLGTLRQFLREGSPWRRLRAGADTVSGSTLRRSLARWAETAVLAKVHARLVAMLRGNPTLILDSGSVRAKRGGNLTCPNPADRTEGHEIPFGRGRRGQAGGPAWRPPRTSTTRSSSSGGFLAAFAVMARIRTVFADKGYDAKPRRTLCQKFHADPFIHKRGLVHGSGLRKQCWPLEHLLSWLLENKRLGLHYDRCQWTDVNPGGIMWLK